jgi:hypothetical protein
MKSRSRYSVRHSPSNARAAYVPCEWLIRAAALCLTTVALFGCATIGEHYHGVQFWNDSSSVVHDAEVGYGQRTLRFHGRMPPKMSDGTAGQMRMPNEMTVTWTVADGKRVTKTVPIRLKGVVLARQVEVLEVRLTDNGIELIQGVAVHPSGRDYTKIYP